MRGVNADREYGVAPAGYRLPDGTRVGKIRLQVSDLARSTAYYRDLLGFEARDLTANTVALAARGDPDWLIELHYAAGTIPVPRRGVLGLYHFALLVPSREILGRFIRHLVSTGIQFGSADHLVSEATYLWDPDGLGIEVYTDRPRERWRTNGPELVMTTERLDLRSLIDVAGDVPWTGMPTGTTIGHLHLSVGDLTEARDFYHSSLGLTAMVWSYPGALFMSAGGYHHHLGTNTWAARARPAGPRDARLLEWELMLPSTIDVEEAAASLERAGHSTAASRDVDGGGRSPSDRMVIDPWQVSLRLRAAQTPDTPTARRPHQPPPR